MAGAVGNKSSILPSPVPHQGKAIDPTFRVLDTSPTFAQLRQENALEALATLFEDHSRYGARLSGDTAEDRIQTVLAYTGAPKSLIHFRVDFSDRGFRADLRDSGLYQSGNSNQVGHFLTAVKLGLWGGPAGRYSAKAAAMGHQMVGEGAGRSTAELVLAQVLKGFLSPRKVRQFADAIAQAKAGNVQGARQAVEAALPEVPWSHEKWNDSGSSWWTDTSGKKRKGRMGNSRQDLLLSAYGFALAELVREGQLQTPLEVASWLRRSLSESAAQSPSAQVRRWAIK